MIFSTQIAVTKATCDGCGYLIGVVDKQLDDGTVVMDHVTTLRVPATLGAQDDKDGFLELHFHGPEMTTNDCFRYWAHSPHVMEKSLRDRGWTDAQIDDFMATHLYRRADGTGPGVAREKR